MHPMFLTAKCLYHLLDVSSSYSSVTENGVFLHHCSVWVGFTLCIYVVEGLQDFHLLAQAGWSQN